MKMRATNCLRVVRLRAVLVLALLLGLAPQPMSAANFAEATQPEQRHRNMLVTPALTLRTIQRAGGLRFVKRSITENNKRLYRTINATYPQLARAKDANAEHFNRLVRELITGEVNDFRKDVNLLEGDLPEESRTSTFDGEYIVEQRGPRLISISFGISVYSAGAAHPNHYTRVLNYDLDEGRVLKLSDLFKPRSNYMRVISEYAIKELKESLGEGSDSEWIERGASPDSANYKSWNITPNGLSVTFDPYQVASYAAGEHVVVVPYSALRQIVNPDGPLGK